MLILTRRAGESLCIGEQIVVTVCRVNGNRVQIGISAPASDCVLRGELAAALTESPDAGLPQHEPPSAA